MAEAHTTYTCYALNQSLGELLLEAIPGFKLKPLYKYNEILALAEKYMEVRKFPNDGQRVNVTGDKIVDLIHTEFVGMNKKYLWRTIYPLLEVITLQVDPNARKRPNINTPPHKSVGARHNMATMETTIMMPNNGLPTRMVVSGGESSKVIKVEKPSLIDDDEQPCSSGYATADTSELVETSATFQNQRKRTSFEMDVQVETRDEVEGPTQSKKQNISKKQLILERQFAEMREQSAKFLATQPDKTFWFYLKPRPEVDVDDDDSFEEDDNSDTETVAYDDVGKDDLDSEDLYSSDTDAGEEPKVKLIDDQVKIDQVMDIRSRVDLIMTLQRARAELIEEAPPEFDDCCDSIDYESACEDVQYWDCPVCPHRKRNDKVKAFCRQCGILRPTVAPREAYKNRRLYLNRPNALNLAEMASSTRKPYNWLEERSIGNVFMWNLLGHQPPLEFDTSVRAVAGAVPKHSRFYLRYPMFVVPRRRNMKFFRESDRFLMSGSGLPWLDEVQSGDTVDLLYSINTGKCAICHQLNGRDALLIHDSMEAHTSCYTCAEFMLNTHRKCPFCRKKILHIAQNNKFKSLKATVR